MEDEKRSWFENHPGAFLAVLATGSVLACMPICYLFGMWTGKAAGKEAAKLFLEAGVRI